MIRLDRNCQVDLRDTGVLVVDDEQFSRTVVRQCLVNIQCGRVDTAESGTHALERLLHAPQAYDAVITDVRMPDMDGLELLRRVRGGAPGVPRDLVVGILTGFSDKEVIGHAFNLDVDFFVSKPPTIDSLRIRLTKALATSRPIKSIDVYRKLDQQAAKGKGKVSLTPIEPADGPAGDEGSTDTLLPIGAAQEGMVLADDLRTASGTLILQAGYRLTPALIERLRDLAEIDPHVASIPVVAAQEDS
jgi:two-component system chemotaxis response regulator CheY